MNILDILAPCGLNCQKCLAYNQGDIKRHSQELKKCLGNFDNCAKRFVKFSEVFENYTAFKELLDVFSKGGCNGCRNGGCINTACNVVKCYKQKEVDFCFQCKDFPCENSGFDENLKTRWIASNIRMKEIGPEKYLDEIKDSPRYV